MNTYEQLVDRIYEATTEPDLWPSLLQDIGRDAEAAGGCIATRRQDQWPWMGFRASAALNGGLDSYARSDAASRSISTGRLMAANRPGFVTDQELFTEQEYSTDPMITDWAGPNGLYHGAATAIRVPTGDLVVVQFMRQAGRPGFDSTELDYFDRFRPHLARAGMLAARWRLERLRAMPEALALIGLPAAVLDDEGRVVAANTLAQELRTYIVWLPGERIAFRDPAANSLLKQAVGELDNPAAPSVRSFPVRAGRFGEPIIAHVIPTATQAREVFEGGFGILVTTSISAPDPPDTAIIQGLFDLTPAEARVACGILAGMTSNEMAERYGVVRETVRTQVKAVLAKTGSRRQVEAAAKLALLPRIAPLTLATKSSAKAIPPPASGPRPATVLQFRARGYLARGAMSK